FAQAFHGTVRDSTNHQPIAGAVFMLLDSSGVVLGRRITDEHGEYGVAVTGAPRWARVVRIGFQPREVRLSGAVDASVPYDLAMIPVPTMLAAVSVRDQSHCGRRSDRAAALGLWEQARAGLLATVVARETNTASVYRLVFERTFDGASDKITRFIVRADSATGVGKSFTASESAADFIANGFASDSAGDQSLYGPDADVLLDDAFAAGYCFRLAAKNKTRPSQVGLSFSPADGARPRGRIDIDGTLWVDTAARAIRDIEYRYVGMARVTDQYRPGGDVSFRQMANGTAMVDRWYVRGIGAQQDTTDVYTPPRVRTWLYASETGGDLARVDWPDGSAWHAPLGSLHVRAVTTDGTPARGATIALPGTPYQGTADANGDIRIGDLEPGPYTVNLMMPPLTDIGLAIPTALKFTAVRDSTHLATLKVPAATNWVSDRCIADRQWDVRDSVFVMGRVVGPGGNPVAGVKVEFFFEATAGLWALLPDFYTTGTDGLFQSCSYTYIPGGKMRITATVPGREPFAQIVPLLTNLNTVVIHLPRAP
ncbi:MAG: hypothetical protein ACHQSE_13730, partial [Gemmatimonadales bacterium]